MLGNVAPTLPEVAVEAPEGAAGVVTCELVVDSVDTEELRTKQRLIQTERLAAIGRMAEDHHGCGGDAIARGILFYAASHDPLPNLLSGFLTIPLVVPNALTTACRRRAASGKTGTGGA